MKAKMAFISLFLLIGPAMAGDLKEKGQAAINQMFGTGGWPAARAGDVAPAPKVKGAPVYKEITEKMMLNDGLALGSKLWAQVKGGQKYQGAGRTARQWADYLTNVESERTQFLESLRPEVRKRLERIPLKIKGLGAGGDYSNGEIRVGYSAHGQAIGNSTITHEYFHALWDLDGKGGQARMIDRGQFRRDTERLAHDPDFQNTAVMSEIRRGWGLDDPNYPEQIQRVRREFPEDIGPDGTIPQVLTERFAHLAEIYYRSPESLPAYIRAHFAPSFAR